ncbi:MAG: DUF2723 domain-containing protein, partial [Candidatus Firestonebacteria bacterium]
MTICPTVYVGDSGEMITASYFLGIPHPPGYPLYTMLGKLLTFIPVGTIAFRVNLLASLFSAGSAIMLFLLLHRFSLLGGLSGLVSTFLPALLSLNFIFSFSFWNQSLITKGGLYTLNAFLLLTIIYICLLAELRSKEKALRLYCYAGIFCGMGLANHTTMIPLFVVFCLYIFVTSLVSIKSAFKNTVVFALTSLVVAFLIYLYLPIRSLANPPMDWGNPETFRAFTRHVLRQQYTLLEPSQRIFSHFLDQAYGYLRAALNQKNVLMVLFPLGLFFLLKHSKKLFVLLVIIFLLTSLGFIYLTNYILNSH